MSEIGFPGKRKDLPNYLLSLAIGLLRGSLGRVGPLVWFWGRGPGCVFRGQGATTRKVVSSQLGVGGGHKATSQGTDLLQYKLAGHCTTAVSCPVVSSHAFLLVFSTTLSSPESLSGCEPRTRCRVGPKPPPLEEFFHIPATLRSSRRGRRKTHTDPRTGKC